MPVVQSLMAELKRKYGDEKGERVYYAMEASGKGPFAKGAKHHDKHVAFASRNGVAPMEGKKKPAASSKKRRAPVKSTRRSR